MGPRDPDRPWYTVVGVVGDMRRRQTPERDPVLQIFEPLAQNSPGSVDLFIRTASDDSLTMAAVGIYGLIQYSVATRTQEIGVRIAIGAQSGDIFRMILGEGLVLSLTGLALGLVGAWWMARAASSLLFGVTATDPLTFITVSLLLTAVAIAACYFPARRAMKLDPIRALRVA